MPLAIYAWGWPTPLQWALFLLGGVIGSAGHFCLTRAMSLADLSATQPVKFLELLWAAVVGFAIWSDVPGRRRCWAGHHLRQHHLDGAARGASAGVGLGGVAPPLNPGTVPAWPGIAEHGRVNAIQICCGIRSGLNVDPLRVIVRGPKSRSRPFAPARDAR